MDKSIAVRFPGGKRVDAEIRGMIVHTDQSPENGGEGTAPEPFGLFMASIATCAGIYALEFCRAREISAEGMSLNMNWVMDEKNQSCKSIEIALNLPAGFPERYKKAIVRVMDLCSVKKTMLHPPEFVLTAS